MRVVQRGWIVEGGGAEGGSRRAECGAQSFVKWALAVADGVAGGADEGDGV